MALRMRSGCDTTTPHAPGTEWPAMTCKPQVGSRLGHRPLPAASLRARREYMWTCWGLNPGPSAREADVMPQRRWRAHPSSAAAPAAARSSPSPQHKPPALLFSLSLPLCSALSFFLSPSLSFSLPRDFPGPRAELAPRRSMPRARRAHSKPRRLLRAPRLRLSCRLRRRALRDSIPRRKRLARLQSPMCIRCRPAGASAITRKYGFVSSFVLLPLNIGHHSARVHAAQATT